MSNPIGDREFLGSADTAGMLATAGTAAVPPVGEALLPGREAERRAAGFRIRLRNAQRAYAAEFPEHPSNGEEDSYPYLGNYGKGLPHNEFGEVDSKAYEALREAFRRGRPEDFETVPVGGTPVRPQLNPQSALAFDALGRDSHSIAVPPVPRLDSAAGSADAAENYWMALLRDVPFTGYESNADVAAAAADLSRYSAFRGPKVDGAVTPGTLFRGDTADDLVGPHISQFLLQDVQFGTKHYDQRQDTVAPGVDYLTDFDEWLAVQNGAPRPYEPGERDPANPRYIQTARDMAHWTHFDQAYQGYLHAALILLALGAPPAEILDPGNPYHASRNQTGFVTWGTPAVLTLLAEVNTRALKANLFQQWGVHRRLRPEEHGGRIEVHLGRCRGRYDGILHSEILESEVLERSRARFGSYLMPQAFKEGSPMSPEHPSGHAIVSSASVTILKAWFNEAFPMPDPVVPDRAGTALVPYNGYDRDRLTLGGELNKLFGNVGYGRNMGGVHSRSSIQDSMAVGEEVAISVLRDHKATTLEQGTLSFTRFDGRLVTI